MARRKRNPGEEASDEWEVKKASVKGNNQVVISDRTFEFLQILSIYERLNLISIIDADDGNFVYAFIATVGLDIQINGPPPECLEQSPCLSLGKQVVKKANVSSVFDGFEQEFANHSVLTGSENTLFFLQEPVPGCDTFVPEQLFALRSNARDMDESMLKHA